MENEFKVIASDGYIGIIDIQYGIEDHVIWFNGWIKNPKKHKSKLYYSSKKDDLYFIGEGTKHYLQEFVRMTIWK